MFGVTRNAEDPSVLRKRHVVCCETLVKNLFGTFILYFIFSSRISATNLRVRTLYTKISIGYSTAVSYTHLDVYKRQVYIYTAVPISSMLCICVK